jgi:hypothetical protein
MYRSARTSICPSSATVLRLRTRSPELRTELRSTDGAENTQQGLYRAIVALGAVARHLLFPCCALKRNWKEAE